MLNFLCSYYDLLLFYSNSRVRFVNMVYFTCFGIFLSDFYTYLPYFIDLQIFFSSNFSQFLFLECITICILYHMLIEPTSSVLYDHKKS